jgi:hypothetical protein
MNTLTEVFPCFFLSCKANAIVNAQRGGTARNLPNFCVVACIVCFVSFCLLFVCICVLYYCHRVATRLQLNDMIPLLTAIGLSPGDIVSYHITYLIISRHFGPH